MRAQQEHKFDHYPINIPVLNKMYSATAVAIVDWHAVIRIVHILVTSHQVDAAVDRQTTHSTAQSIQSNSLAPKRRLIKIS